MRMTNDTTLSEQAGGASELIALLTEQCGLYEQLAALSESQRQLITGDKAEKLLTLLGDRQRLLDRVQELAVKMRPYQSTWARLRQHASREETEEVDRLLGKVNAMLAAIISTDKADAQLLAVRRSATGQEMSTLKTGRTAGAAYAAAAYGAASQRDWTDK